MSSDLHRLGDSVDDAIGELLELLPQLGHALERDAGMADGERVSTSTNVHVDPVNADVLGALVLLQVDVWPVVHRARACLGESADALELPALVASAGILFRRLVGRQLNGEARALAGSVFRWHRTVRRALGLSTRPRPLSGGGRAVHCPLHDDPLTTLRQAGDEARVDAAAAGEREAITWQRGGGLFCPHCGGEWGPSEYAFLGRLVGEQRLRLRERRDVA